MLHSVQEAPILPQSVNPNLPTIYPLRPRQQIYKRKILSSLISVFSGKLTMLQEDLFLYH